jgi:branched-chain amino acid aminotransferase
VIDLCEMEGIPLVETTITADDMLEADEIFITSEAGGIMPSGTLNGEPIGGGKGPGPITARLHDLYWNKRWEGWDAIPVPYAE